MKFIRMNLAEKLSNPKNRFSVFSHTHITVAHWYTTTIRPFPTKLGWLHGSNCAIIVFGSCHRDSTKFYVGC